MCRIFAEYYKEVEVVASDPVNCITGCPSYTLGPTIHTILCIHINQPILYYIKYCYTF